MPILFKQHDPPFNVDFVAYSIDNVNCIVDKHAVDAERVFTGKPNESLTTIFTDYVLDLFSKAGYKNVYMPDSSLYHSGRGNLHCGTNVRRSLPQEKWWE